MTTGSRVPWPPQWPDGAGHQPPQCSGTKHEIKAACRGWVGTDFVSGSLGFQPDLSWGHLGGGTRKTPSRTHTLTRTGSRGSHSHAHARSHKALTHLCSHTHPHSGTRTRILTQVTTVGPGQKEPGFLTVSTSWLLVLFLGTMLPKTWSVTAIPDTAI